MSKLTAVSGGADTTNLTTDAKDAKAPAQALRTSILKMSKNMSQKVLRITLPVSFSFVNTAANTVAVAAAVDLTTSVEWTNLQALYDEYRFISGKTCWQALTPSAGVTPDVMPVMAWDPVDSTVLTNTRNGCELKHHKLYSFPNNSGGNGVVIGDRPMTFVYAPVKRSAMESVAINSSGNITAAPGMWKSLPTAGSNAAPDGYIKMYWTNGTAGLSAVVVGIHYWTVECRSRK